MLSALWAPLAPLRPRRQGGFRQRAAAAEVDAAQAQPARISRLFGNQLLQWCEGGLSAAQLQKNASDGLLDGFSHPMMSRLAGVGSGQHAHEGICGLLRRCGVLECLTRYPDEGVSDFVLPSTWVRVLKEYPHEFNMRLGADQPKLRRWWTDFASRPCNAGVMANHPAVAGRSMAELAHVVPLVIHSDGAPYSKSRSMVAINFSSLLGVGEAKLTKFTCCTFLKGDGDRSRIAWTHVLEDLEAMAVPGWGGVL